MIVGNSSSPMYLIEVNSSGRRELGRVEKYTPRMLTCDDVDHQQDHVLPDVYDAFLHDRNRRRHVHGACEF